MVRLGEKRDQGGIDLKIYTGYFARLKHYVEAGLFPVSIARSCRFFKGPEYIALAPAAALKGLNSEDYTALYIGMLSGLNPEEVMVDLEKLSCDRPVVLLCYEKSESFCHRHIVREWLNVELDAGMKEWKI